MSEQKIGNTGEQGLTGAFMRLLERQRLLTVLLIIFAADFIIYGQSLFFTFQWDDIAVVKENPAIRHIGNMWPPFGTRYVGFLTFAVNYGMGVLDPFVYHLTNVIIHGINGVLVWWLAITLLGTPVLRRAGIEPRHADFIAFFSALIFVVHPVNTQAVAYVAQRFASLATLFYVLAVILYVKGRIHLEESESSRRSGGITVFILAVIASLLAMKTKEISFTIPVTLFACEVLLFRGSLLGAKRFAFLVPFVITSIVVPLSVGSRFIEKGDSLNDFVSTVMAETDTISRPDYLYTQFRVIVTYLRLFFVPVGQTLDYDYPVYSSLFSLPVLASFVLLVAVVAGAGLLYVRSVRNNSAQGIIIALGVFWFFIALSVESSVVPIRDVIFEHRMYLPLAGLVMSIAAALSLFSARIKGGLGLAVKIAVAASLVLGITAYVRCGVWRNPVTLWEDVVKKSPAKARGYSNLGDSYINTDRNEDAVVVLRKAVEIKPDYVEGHGNLGLAYSRLSMHREAIDELRKSIEYGPLYYIAYINMAKVYQNLNRYDEAIGLYNEALRIKPDNPVALDSLGTLYFQLGLFDRAVKEFRAATRLRPDYVNARINLAHAYLVLGDIDAALEQYEILKTLRYKDPDLHFNLAIAYSMKGRTMDAMRELEKVLKDNPGDIEAKKRLDALRAGI